MHNVCQTCGWLRPDRGGLVSGPTTGLFSALKDFADGALFLNPSWYVRQAAPTAARPRLGAIVTVRGWAVSLGAFLGSFWGLWGVGGVPGLSRLRVANAVHATVALRQHLNRLGTSCAVSLLVEPVLSERELSSHWLAWCPETRAEIARSLHHIHLHFQKEARAPCQFSSALLCHARQSFTGFNPALGISWQLRVLRIQALLVDCDFPATDPPKVRCAQVRGEEAPLQKSRRRWLPKVQFR